MIKRVTYKIILLLCLALVVQTCKNFNRSKIMKAPVAEKISKEINTNGHIRTDNYFWLCERDNPKVIKYLESENAFTKAVMKDTEKLQEKLYNEIVGRIKQTDMSVPYFENGYFYYTRYEDGKEYPVYCRKKESLEAKEEILLNVNEMAAGHEYYHVAGYKVSMNNNLIAFGVDTLGRRLYTIYFKDLSTGRILDDKIQNTSGSAAWSNDNNTVFYTLKDTETLRPYKILKHKLGAGSADKIVYEEKDDTFYIYVYKTKSRRFIIIASYSTLSNEYRFNDADNPDSEFKLFHPRERKLEYDIDHFEDKFFIRTNLDAINFRLMETPVKKTGRENWKEIIPHREDALVENFELFKNYLVVDERVKGLTQLRIINIKDNSEHYIDFEEQAYTAWISTNPEFDTQVLRFGYSSMTTPNSTYDYNMITKDKKLMKQQEVVGDFKPENYTSERLFAQADDGTQIPISLVYRKGIVKSGDNPLLLYGYGSYGHTTEPSFSSEILSLLDRGFIYAVAHIRGGQIMGRKWYEDGKLLKKKNTFTDFNDCAEYLINENYTDTNYLFAMGGSAGGLLIGAIINMKPELYRAVIAAVPFVDVVTTMLDESIPLTTAEYDEWGNPNIKEYYNYMLSYSPYDNVSAVNYPAMLVTTGLHDSQVQYWEPAKWVAKLRELKTDDNILLLHTNMDTGHSGATGRFKRYKETALEYAFLLKLSGIKD
ncbi:MAG: S9 family peptidase [Bacteroidales bacterium]|nr:MAG: S9 family peptidase [Bacteroidales bacterium]